MTNALEIQGQKLYPEDLEYIGRLVAEHPDLSRFKLSLLLAERWDWRNAKGRLKDMAARTLMLKLHRRGLIVLPPPRGQQPTRRTRSKITVDDTAISGPLAALRPLQIEVVAPGHADRILFEACLERHHYLGFRGHVGENLAYLIRDCQRRPVACLLFGAAAWKCMPRDEFIGWTAPHRAERLSLVTSNTRFLILPWVRVKYLATHILGCITRRLSADWKAKYGHPIYLVESFVDRSRFAGTCYRASNWINVGTTQGRGRQDRFWKREKPIKDILVYPLCADFRDRLCR